MSGFLAGMITMGFLLAGLFFFRFWWRTQDFLFVAFGCAFVLLAINQAVVALALVPREEQPYVYVLRLLAFGLLIVAIIAKNVGGAKDPSN
jgi:hypothetical protein